jgi:multiple sugar transport system permease protein
MYLFLGLPVAYLLALVGFPIAYNVLMSLQEVVLSNIANFVRPFVGLDNYREAAADPAFRKVLVNSLLFVSINVLGQIAIGLGVALFFAQRFPGAHYLRGLLLSSWMLPALVVGALWKWLFATDYGVVNFALSSLRIINAPVHWLSDPAIALTSVTIANIWFGMPFSMILIAAALTGVPQELYEAAALDGAGPVARFRYVTLPAITPTLLAVACLDLYDAGVRFDLCHDPRRSARFQQRTSAVVLSVFVPAVSFRCRSGGRHVGVRHRLCGRPCLRAHSEQGAVGMRTALRLPRLRGNSLVWSIVGALGVAIYLFPIYWMFISGLKTAAEIFANPPTLFPRRPTLETFEYVFLRENVLRYLRNSLTIALPVTAITLVLGSMGSYAMYRIRSRIVDVALMIVLMLQVFPEALLATPMFIIFRTLGILNTFSAVILATASKTLAFALVILRPNRFSGSCCR